MAGYRFTPEAESAICDAYAILAKSPMSGQVREEIHQPPCQVLHPDARPLQIVRILHGTSDFKRILISPKSS